MSSWLLSLSNCHKRCFWAFFLVVNKIRSDPWIHPVRFTSFHGPIVSFTPKGRVVSHYDEMAVWKTKTKKEKPKNATHSISSSDPWERLTLVSSPTELPLWSPAPLSLILLPDPLLLHCSSTSTFLPDRCALTDGHRWILVHGAWLRSFWRKTCTEASINIFHVRRFLWFDISSLLPSSYFIANSQITVCNQRAVMKDARGEKESNCTSLSPVNTSLEIPESLFFLFFFDDVKVAVTRPTSQTQPQKQEDAHLLCESHPPPFRVGK